MPVKSDEFSESWKLIREVSPTVRLEDLELITIVGGVVSDGWAISGGGALESLNFYDLG